tara:strand:- start:1111 stop:1509 length:399 start_codon:yes stop_codon:yes gene_type:complete
MATNKRTYPNTYFAWYNDDDRVAILTQDTTSTSGERTQEKYDTYQGDDVTSGLRITYHSKYETANAQDDDLKVDLGLDSGLHPSIVCYVKARIYEDIGDLQKSQYFRVLYEKMMKQYPARKSGVRTLAVPRL